MKEKLLLCTLDDLCKWVILSCKGVDADISKLIGSPDAERTFNQAFIGIRPFHTCYYILTKDLAEH